MSRPEAFPLPTLCLTAQEPWPQAMAYAGKCLENRGIGVASQLGEWRGIIGISQSKVNIPENKVYHDVVETMRELADDGLAPWRGKTMRELNVGAWRGKLCLVAELINIVAPQYMRHVPLVGHPYSQAKRWYVDGEFGLILGSVWEVEPVRCTGGVGAWRADSWCTKCGHVYADSARVPKQCYSCKAPFWEFIDCHRPGVQPKGERPMLRVLRECST